MTDPSPLEQMAAMDARALPDLRDGAAARADLDEMPLVAGCPIVPLGVQGDLHFALDNVRQLRTFGFKIDKGLLYSLCGEQLAWLDKAYPVYNDKGDIKPHAFNQDKAQRAIVIACQRKGLFDPRDAVRGRGTHLAENGALVLHCGNALLIAGEPGVRSNVTQPPKWRETGLYQDMIFPTAKKIQHPDKASATRAEMWDLLCGHFCSWNWQGPSVVTLEGEAVNIHAWLAFGWAQMAKVCGALPQRPSIWITGPSSAGKSGLHDTLRGHIGKGWHLASKDMTASWASQMLGQDRIAVLFDEAEPNNQNPTYHEQILQLAKLAYDGSSKGRGGADGKATTTEVYSCFQFSSVILPNMKPEDRNRMIIVEIDKFPPGTPPYIEPPAVRGLAAKAHMRLAEGWHRFAATLAAYRGAMMARNWSAREANTYGMVLACADLALYDDTPDPDPFRGCGRIHHLLDKVQPLLVTSRMEGEDHPELCIHHLVSTQLQATGGRDPMTVAQWLIRGITEAVATPAARDVDRKLQAQGLRLVTLRADHMSGNGQGGLIRLDTFDWRNGYLAIAGRTNQGVAALFKGSNFAGGGWMKALERLKFRSADAAPEDVPVCAVRNKRVRFGGGDACAAVLVPLAALIDLDEVASAIDAALADIGVMPDRGEAAAKKRRAERGIKE